MDAYVSDLYWAQEYAARNRAVMESDRKTTSDPTLLVSDPMQFDQLQPLVLPQPSQT